MTINVLDIVRGTTVDGPGFRTSIYVAGCKHECPGCHNPQSWDFAAGTRMTIDELMDIIREEDFDVTLTGGDPMYHPEFVAEIARRIKEEGHSTWVYTGYTIEELRERPDLMAALSDVEAIVEGPFILSLRDTDLRFRGSSNQRIIYL